MEVDGVGGEGPGVGGMMGVPECMEICGEIPKIVGGTRGRGVQHDIAYCIQCTVYTSRSCVGKETVYE